MFKKTFKSKRGSEVVQTLIVIAIMGALAIFAFGNMSKSLNAKNNEIIGDINNDIEWSKPTETPKN